MVIETTAVVRMRRRAFWVEAIMQKRGRVNFMSKGYNRNWIVRAENDESPQLIEAKSDQARRQVFKLFIEPAELLNIFWDGSSDVGPSGGVFCCAIQLMQS